MNFAKTIILLIIGSIFIFGSFAGCSKEEDNENSDLLERVAKDRKKIADKRKHKTDFTDEQLAIVDKCSDKLSICLEKCESESCENQCLKELSICEKELPLELKTIKKN